MNRIWEKSLFIVYLFSNLLLLVIPAIFIVARSTGLHKRVLEESSRRIATQFNQPLYNFFDRMDIYTVSSPLRRVYINCCTKKLHNYDSYPLPNAPRNP